MATTTLEPPSTDHLQAEALPLIDLRLLSQSELHALSLSSASSIVDHHHSDNIIIPTIDRSVFNESAGSRKQTYSRLRLAPRKPQQICSESSSPLHPGSYPKNSIDNIDCEENRKIVGLLKELFAEVDHNVKDGDDNDLDSLVPVKVEYGDSVPKLSNAVLQTIAVDVADDGSGGGGAKRKRGRPKMEKAVVENDDDDDKDVNRVDMDKEMANRNGFVVDISALASIEDPYGPELRRRTEGMVTEDELLGFLGGLVGQWGSRRKKRKIVEASDFGDALPEKWKLLLSLKKKDGHAWLICRRYIRFA